MVVAVVAVLAALGGTAMGAKLWGWSGPPNPLLNPDFEDGAQHWGLIGFEVTPSTTDCSHGEGCVQISGTGSDYLYQQRVTLLEGVFTITYWRKTIRHVSNTGAGLLIGDETGVHTGGYEWTYPDLGTTPWTQVPAITITVTRAGSFGFYLIGNRWGGTGSGTVRFDRVEVERVHT